MNIKEVETFWAEICIAGDMNIAKGICAKCCNEIGLCVTIETVDFVYSGGMEKGVKIRLVNYPRFPSDKDDIIVKMKSLAQLLINGMHQRTALVLTPDKTFWLYRDLPFEQQCMK